MRLERFFHRKNNTEGDVDPVEAALASMQEEDGNASSQENPIDTVQSTAAVPEVAAVADKGIPINPDVVAGDNADMRMKTMPQLSNGAAQKPPEAPRMPTLVLGDEDRIDAPEQTEGGINPQEKDGEGNQKMPVLTPKQEVANNNVGNGHTKTLSERIQALNNPKNEPEQTPKVAEKNVEEAPAGNEDPTAVIESVGADIDRMQEQAKTDKEEATSTVSESVAPKSEKAVDEGAISFIDTDYLKRQADARQMEKEGYHKEAEQLRAEAEEKKAPGHGKELYGAARNSVRSKMEKDFPAVQARVGGVESQRGVDEDSTENKEPEKMHKMMVMPNDPRVKSIDAMVNEGAISREEGIKRKRELEPQQKTISQTEVDEGLNKFKEYIKEFEPKEKENENNESAEGIQKQPETSKEVLSNLKDIENDLRKLKKMVGELLSQNASMAAKEEGEEGEQDLRQELENALRKLSENKNNVEKVDKSSDDIINATHILITNKEKAVSTSTVKVANAAREGVDKNPKNKKSIFRILTGFAQGLFDTASKASIAGVFAGAIGGVSIGAAVAGVVASGLAVFALGKTVGLKLAQKQ